MNIIESIHSHRSIRKYKSDPVPGDVMSEILTAGIRASSCGNMQSYSVIVSQDLSIREQLSTAHHKQQMVLDAPAHLTFCADFNRMRKWLKLNDAPDNFNNLMGFMIGAIDATLVSQNVALAAESKGLGICYLGSTLSNCDQISKVLRLPSGVLPVVGYTLGYPDEDPALRDRLPLDGIVHEEIYHDYSDEQIQTLYKDKEEKGWERYMNDDWLRQMIEKQGVENLAQVYTVVKYPQDKYQGYSQTVLDFLAKQDFLAND